MTSTVRRQIIAATGGVVLFLMLAGVGALYAATGGGARDRQVSLLFIYITLVIALQIFIGNSGVFSLGHMGLAGVGAYAAAILTASRSVKQLTIPDAPLGLASIEVPVPVGVLIGVVVAAGVGAVAGLAVSRLSGLAALIVTLALLVIINNVLTNWASLTGGAEAFYGYPLVAEEQWPMLAALVAIVVALVFRESDVGTRLQATREDELAAEASGVSVTRTRFAGWVLSTSIVALGGILLALFVGATNPREYFLHLTLLTLAMLVLGGMRSVAGAALGAVLIFAGTEFTRYLGDGPTLLGVDVPPLFGLSTLFLGAVILVVMLLRPEGLFADRDLHHLLLARFPKLRLPPARPSPSAAPLSGSGHNERSARLVVRDLTKRFAGLTALGGVSLEVSSGEIVGLIGPNGAGKTTLINLVTALTPVTDGDIELNGSSLTGLDPFAVARRGVARTFQNIRLFPELTVRQNVAVAASIAAQHRGSRRGLTTDELLEEFSLTEVAERKAGTLPYGPQRLVEMARAAALRPDIMLLDEPAAGMNRRETNALLERVKQVRNVLDCGVIVVDHDLHFIMGLCDRIYVLNGGVVIAHGSPDEIQKDPEVIAAYLGTRSRTPSRPEIARTPGTS